MLNKPVADKKIILVTGANGQLGKALQVIAPFNSAYEFLFTTKEDLPIEDAKAVNNYFAAHAISFCINCAAYTAVDKAETEKETAFLMNATAVGNLATACKQYNATLIHISTDYVFDGTSKQPYKESDATCPINIYGTSKLKGEALALLADTNNIVIRTSWVYSSFGNNFVKTMLRLMKERESINVVSDQQGCPTYAADLAAAILQIISSPLKNTTPQIFNYTNTGITNWYEFALAIKDGIQSNCIVNPIATTDYPTPAKRPAYSVLDTTKIQQTYTIVIPNWKESLYKCLALLK